MKSDQEIKEVVRDKYASIARSKSGCGCGCSKTETTNIIDDDYARLDGYEADADLGLGCGLPTEFAAIKQGDTVLDLGSGAGNDVFIARRITGDSGRVIGVDMTREMIDLAERNRQKLGYDNVEFHLGDIENLPLDDERADVVISNCVLNLVPDKRKAFDEIKRVTKSGGHFCVSDIVIQGVLPKPFLESAAMYAGCVAGALQQDAYLQIIRDSGFEQIEVKKKNEIVLPESVLHDYLNDEQFKTYNESKTGIFSITVTGIKS